MSDTVNGVYLDFKEIKAKTDVRKVLEYLGILEHLEEQGAELSGWCPLGKGHGREDSFSVNAEKRIFQCFACKARGSILDLVAKLQGTDLRGAAQAVLAIMEESDQKPAEESAADRKGKHRPYGAGTPGTVTYRPFLDWDEAASLIKQKKLAPENVVVLDLENIEMGLGFSRSRRG